MDAPTQLLVNDDDDNGNGNPDRDDLFWWSSARVAGEDDLRPVSLASQGCPPGLCESFRLHPCWLTNPIYYIFFTDPDGGIIHGLNWNDDPIPTTLYIGGNNTTSICGVAVGYEFVGCCDDVTGFMQVVGMWALDWEKHAGASTNLEIDSCPNNGGRRVFPDSLAPDDPNPNVRRKVDLVATVEPPIPGITVYIRVWDVDDPVDQLHGPQGSLEPVADVGQVDDDRMGPDNRGTGASLGAFTAVTDAEGKARVTINVSMQPGDNFRAGASLLQDAIGQASQATADALSATLRDDGLFTPRGSFAGYSVPLTWSPMLTVWRKLHVETDAMLRPTFTENTVAGAWNEPRFVGGQLWLDITDQPDADSFENGYIRIQAPGSPDLVSVVITHSSSLFDDEILTNISQTEWGTRPNAGTFTACDDDISNQGLFQGGVVGSVIGVGDPPTGYLPFPDISGLSSHYRPAYILPVLDPSCTSSGGITFVRNIEDLDDPVAWNAALAQRCLPVSAASFWTAYVYSSFQAERDQDFDGEIRATKGISTHADSPIWGVSTRSSLGPQYTGMCTVFMEALRDGFGDAEERITIAHEIAHTLGVDHTTGLMGKNAQTDAFSGLSLRELREYSGP